MVSSSLPGVSANSGANAPVICGANSIPRIASTAVTRISAFMARLPRPRGLLSLRGQQSGEGRHESCRHRALGEQVPSRFGTRKATLNASICALAPNTAARTISRTTPSRRLAIVAAPISPADFASLELMLETLQPLHCTPWRAASHGSAQCVARETNWTVGVPKVERENKKGPCLRQEPDGGWMRGLCVPFKSLDGEHLEKFAVLTTGSLRRTVR